VLSRLGRLVRETYDIANNPTVRRRFPSAVHRRLDREFSNSTFLNVTSVVGRCSSSSNKNIFGAVLFVCRASCRFEIAASKELLRFEIASATGVFL